MTKIGIKKYFGKQLYGERSAQRCEIGCKLIHVMDMCNQTLPQCNVHCMNILLSYWFK